jgi:2-hydroxy-3-oxopropionate reductase
MSKETVGFIGLGVMGAPMALNLMRAGYELIAYNRTRAKADALAAEGAIVAHTAREAAAGADVIITMLPDSPDVLKVAHGEHGVLAGARPGALWIDMSTISPIVARELALDAARYDVEALDAPVSGGDVGAREGTLSIMVGGTESAFARARPIFDVLGSTVVRCGDNGAGQITKCCNQVIVALTIEAVSEALVLGSRAGLDPETMLDVLGGGLAGNRVMEVRRRNFLEHDFAPGFRIDLHHKDLGIALATARSYGVGLPNTAAVDQMLQGLRNAGHGDDDHSALLTAIEQLAGHRVGSVDEVVV